nr:hypothetical protein [uncultured Methanobrevibacter sp.]
MSDDPSTLLFLNMLFVTFSVPVVYTAPPFPQARLSLNSALLITASFSQ